MGRRLNLLGGVWSRLRPVVFWMHLVTGVAAGLVVLVMAVTGVLLAYEPQILDWAAARHAVVPPSPGAARLPLDTVMARARNAAGEPSIVSLEVYPAGNAPVAVGLANRTRLLLDPYTAAVVGSDSAWRSWFAVVQRGHRWLAFNATARPAAGKAVTGAANLGFLLLILSGFCLWWPRQWSGRAFRAVLLFTRGARGKARDWNWHHVLGIWSAPVLVLIVASAAFMSYEWPGRLAQRAFGEDAGEGGRGGRGERGEQGEFRGGRAGRGRETRRPEGAAEVSPVAFGANLDSVIAAGIHEVPGWRSLQLRLPQRPAMPLTLVLATGPRPDQRVQATFDAETGAVLRWQRYADGSPYRRFRSWIRPLHTGEAGGLLGQTVAALVSAAAVVLVWTGIALAWRRLRASLHRRDRAAVLQREKAA